MSIALTRFRIKPGQSHRVDEWVATLNRRLPNDLQTDEREPVLMEGFFRIILDGQDYLNWFSMQKHAGNPLDKLPQLDRAYLAFWEECIEPDFAPPDASSQTIRMPEAIARSMTTYFQTLSTHAAVVPPSYTKSSLHKPEF